MPCKVAIIIVSYNGEKYLPDCLRSLKEQDYPAADVRIIMVDNASRDDSAGYARRNFPAVFLIQNSVNSGFAGGNNIGIRKALEGNPDFVVLLNQDTIVDKDWLREAVKKAESSPDIGAVQSLLLLWDNQDLIQTSGNKIHYLGFGYSGEYKKQRSAIGDRRSGDIAYASGAAVLFKASVLREVGLFDEDMFAYHEDLDLGWRIRLAGYGIKLAPLSVVYHKYSFGRNKLKNLWMERNRFVVLLKNYRWATLLLISPALLAMEMGMLFYALSDGWLMLKLRSYVEVILTLPRTLSKRKIIQRSRKAKDGDIVRFFSGRVEFAELQNPILKYVANPALNLYWQLIRRMIRW